MGYHTRTTPTAASGIVPEHQSTEQDHQSDILVVAPSSNNGTTSSETELMLNMDTNSNPYEYKEDVAALLAAISGWSYGTMDDFMDVLAYDKRILLPNAKYTEISRTNEPLLIVATAQIIRTADRKTVIVCFRGTELTNIVNWLTDATTGFVPWKVNDDVGSDKKDGRKRVEEDHILIHEGFTNNFKVVWEGDKGAEAQLLKYNDDALESIYITGHSLGGAMAVLGGLSLALGAHRHRSGEDSAGQRQLWRKLRGVYTYGQPMVVNRTTSPMLEHLLDRRLFRHVYFNDIVPHMPSLSMGLYAHVGTEYRYHPQTKWLKKISGKTTCTQIKILLGVAPFAILDALGGTFPFLSVIKSPWSFLDHSPRLYMDSLNDREGHRNPRGFQCLWGFISNDTRGDVMSDRVPCSKGATRMW